jgi:hypothetical protein
MQTTKLQYNSGIVCVIEHHPEAITSCPVKLILMFVDLLLKIQTHLLDITVAVQIQVQL